MPSTQHAYSQVTDVYFPIAIAVFVIAVGTLAVLIIAGARRSKPGRRTEALPQEIAYALILAFITAFLLWRTFSAETPIDHLVSDPGLRVKVTAAQWSWRFEYPNGMTVTDVATWHPAVAVVPTGTEVQFDGISKDVLHGFWVPQLDFMRQLIPGTYTQFDLLFTKAGLYGGVCSVYCGEDHSEMHFELEAVSPGEFQRWMRTHGRVM